MATTSKSGTPRKSTQARPSNPSSQAARPISGVQTKMPTKPVTKPNQIGPSSSATGAAKSTSSAKVAPSTRLTPKTSASRPSSLPQTRRERLDKLKAERKRKTQGVAGLSGSTWTAIIAGVIALAIIIFAFVSAMRGGDNGSSPLGIGTLNPNVTPLAVGAQAKTIPVLKDLDNKDYDPSQYIGKQPVLLELFATWCPNCQEYTKALNQAYTDYDSKGLKVISIVASPYGHNYENSGGTDKSPTSLADMQWFHETKSIKYAELFDKGMAAANTYGLVGGGYPTTYLIDSTGKITYAQAGVRDYNELKTEIEKIIKK
jgi:peroxiredoxin